MKDKQRMTTLLFGVVTFLTIIGKGYPPESNIRLILTIVSVLVAIPYLYIFVKEKMYENRLNLFVSILVIFQIINIIYYTYVLVK